MKKKLALALVAVVIATSTVMGGSTAAQAEVNVYTTEGTHHVNGREWRTACEKYSQTKRCRTEIKATQVTEVNGRFVARTDWVFNNLTYLPSPRTLWKGNPLGGNGTVGARVAWTAPDGRKWSTECDTSTTGSNGCRSYTVSRVIEAYRVNGTWNYRWVTKSVFNNIVMFSAAAPTTPTPPATTTVTMPDANLRECVNDEFGRSAGTAITKADAAKVTELDCGAYGIVSLAGLEYFSNLEALWIDANDVENLAPLKGLNKLRELDAADNFISDTTALVQLKKLRTLDLSSNLISNLAPLAKLEKLMNLYLEDNEITDVTPLAQLQDLSQLKLDLNLITDVAPLAKITNLVDLFLRDNLIANVTPLARMAHLDYLYLDGNQIINVAPLAKITSLNYLGLADNAISTVAPLATLPHLQFLQVYGNPVGDPDSLKPLIERGCWVLFDNPEG